MPTHGFSIKPLKVKLLAGEQSSQPRRGWVAESPFRVPSGLGFRVTWRGFGNPGLSWTPPAGRMGFHLFFSLDSQRSDRSSAPEDSQSMETSEAELVDFQRAISDSLRESGSFWGCQHPVRKEDGSSTRGLGAGFPAVCLGSILPHSDFGCENKQRLPIRKRNGPLCDLRRLA